MDVLQKHSIATALSLIVGLVLLPSMSGRTVETDSLSPLPSSDNPISLPTPLNSINAIDPSECRPAEITGTPSAVLSLSEVQKQEIDRLEKQMDVLRIENEKLRAQKGRKATPLPPLPEIDIPNDPWEKAPDPVFEAIPPSQINPFLHRLEITKKLIQHYHRAYDYRLYTLMELSQILDQLKKTPKHSSSP